EMILREGKNREIRRMLAALGHKVQKLRRFAIGPLKLGSLPLGEYRPLTREEVRELTAAGTRPPKVRGPGNAKEQMSDESPEPSPRPPGRRSQPAGAMPGRKRPYASAGQRSRGRLQMAETRSARRGEHRRAGG